MGRESLFALGFVERRKDLVLMGDVGTGKTHMASALCALACERRLEARLFAAPSLVMRMRRARDDGKPSRMGRAHRQGSPARHRRARVSPARRGRSEAALPGLRRRPREAVGGNHHELGAQQVGGSVFEDDRMAAAVIDRIVHHGKLVQFRGESYRVRRALMREG